MSIFYFRTLVIGSNLDDIHYYISRAFGEPGEDNPNFISWYKEVKTLDSVCDLEIDCLMSISADLDEIIPTVDGILYFINPLNKEELELFEMKLPDIFPKKSRIAIPTIIVCYDRNGILPITVNDLLTHIWDNFPKLLAFVNLAPENFHQVLQCLCLAMINGDISLNIENAWMRFPIFIAHKKINALMEKESVSEITIERQYLPEILSEQYLKISSDGFPMLKNSVAENLLLRGIKTEYLGTVVRFIKNT